MGCVELIDKVRTGSTFHAFINPQRDIPMESFKIHGISEDMVKDKPIFSKIAPSFLEYISNSRLIIHNAGFDVSFLNYELIVSGHPEISMNRVTDTLTLARKKFPGAPASLDALCKRFDISLASRTNHGALIDAELLAMVYVELMGGAQSSFNFNNAAQAVEKAAAERMKREPREFAVSNDDAQKHADFLAKAVKNSTWNAQ